MTQKGGDGDRSRRERKKWEGDVDGIWFLLKRGRWWWLVERVRETGEEENGGGGSRRRRKREAGQKYLGKQKKIHAEEGVFCFLKPLPLSFIAIPIH